MSLLRTLVQSLPASALGWTVFHSLWQGAVVALVLALALCVVRSSRARYAVACLAMFVMLVSFGGTFIRMMSVKAGTLNTIEPRPSPLKPPLGGDNGSLPAVRHLEDVLPWVAPFWIAGVMMLNLYTVLSWTMARRLRNNGVCCAPEPWPQRLDALRKRLQVSRPVMLFESGLATVPVVIGHLNPVILIPAGLLTGLPVQQIEAILLHELA